MDESGSKTTTSSAQRSNEVALRRVGSQSNAKSKTIKRRVRSKLIRRSMVGRMRSIAEGGKDPNFLLWWVNWPASGDYVCTAKFLATYLSTYWTQT